MSPLTNPYLASINAEAFRQERLHDARYFRVGRPSRTLRLVAALASRLESFSSGIRRWSQATSRVETPRAPRTPNVR